MLLSNVYRTQNINEETNVIFNLKLTMHTHTVYTAKKKKVTQTEGVGVDTATVHMVTLLGDAIYANLPQRNQPSTRVSCSCLTPWCK